MARTVSMDKCLGLGNTSSSSSRASLLSTYYGPARRRELCIQQKCCLGASSSGLGVGLSVWEGIYFLPR